MGVMENFALDYEFDLTRSLSDELGYGDGYVGAVQRRHLERKYTITRKPLADVEHPENNQEYAAAVQVYHPGLTEDEALTWLLDNTAYPFDALQTIRQGMRREWFAALDKSPYERMLNSLYPQMDAGMRKHVLGSCVLEPDTKDVESLLRTAAEQIMQLDATIAANRLRAEEKSAETNRKWEEDAPARESRRAVRTLDRARERAVSAEQELARAQAKVAELEALQVE